MKIIVTNRELVKLIEPKEAFVVISITSTNGEFPNLPYNKNRRDVLRLKFDDINSAVEGMFPITEEQALEIIDFVNKWKDSVKLFICQCDGGISRSSGVAIGICYIIGGMKEEIDAFYRMYIPNSRVISTILNKFYDRR